MKVSLYIVGTELVRGIIADKHTQVLTSELSKLGCEVIRSVILPDDGSIEKSLGLGVLDSDVLLITGGLGPTSDDMTRKIIADLAGVPLSLNKSAWDALYARVGERIYGSNEQQAYIPQGFTVVPNPNGTACGFRGVFRKDGRDVVVCAMPGPPAEMQPMLYSSVLPYISELVGKIPEARDEYSSFLISEAKLEELCAQCGISGISWGTRFQQFRISLYINGNDASKRKLFVSQLRKLTGEALIQDGNHEAADLLTEELLKRKCTISCAESCTSGLVAKMLTDTAGSSAWFWGGVASYDNNAKMKLLGVNSDTLETYGAVSRETAMEMADGIRRVSDTDYSVSLTGIAGPSGGSEDKPVGTVWIGFSSKHRQTEAVCLKCSVFSRESARKRFAVASLILTRLYMCGFDVVDIASKWLYI